MDLKIMFLPCSLLFRKPIFTPPWHALICTRQKSLRWEMIVHLSSNQQHPTPSASYLTVSWDAESISACHFGFGALKLPDFTKSFPLLSISEIICFNGGNNLKKGYLRLRIKLFRVSDHTVIWDTLSSMWGSSTYPHLYQMIDWICLRFYTLHMMVWSLPIGSRWHQRNVIGRYILKHFHWSTREGTISWNLVH